MKALLRSPKDRYQTVEELLHDFQTYLEGRSSWIEIARLDVQSPHDWGDSGERQNNFKCFI